MDSRVAMQRSLQTCTEKGRAAVEWVGWDPGRAEPGRGQACVPESWSQFLRYCEFCRPSAVSWGIRAYSAVEDMCNLRNSRAFFRSLLKKSFAICTMCCNIKYGRFIAQAVSRWLPTAAARVQIRV
jgi:hypothetical protein